MEDRLLTQTDMGQRVRPTKLDEGETESARRRAVAEAVGDSALHD